MKLRLALLAAALLAAPLHAADPVGINALAANPADYAGAGLTVQTAAAVKRAGDPPVGLPAPAVEAAFGGPKGYAAVADGEGGAKLVITSTEVTVPPYFSGAPDLAQAEEQFSGEMANDLLTSYVYQLQERLGVTINQVALQTVIGSSQTGPGL